MPKIVTPLTLAQVKAAKAKDKIYKLPDGGWACSLGIAIGAEIMANAM